jgi:hypothetical protein
MNVAVTHRVRHAIDPFLEVVGAAAEQSPHVVDFFPVPLALLFVFPKLPHLPAPAVLSFARW